jgi:hypothetical protein
MVGVMWGEVNAETGRAHSRNRLVEMLSLRDQRLDARLAVPSPIPISVAIAAQERPSERRFPILAISTLTRGRPRRLPFALAFRNPARTRSAIRLRSSSATAPSTVKTILPVGVLVSTCSDSDTNSMPKALNVSRLFFYASARRCLATPWSFSAAAPGLSIWQICTYRAESRSCRLICHSAPAGMTALGARCAWPRKQEQNPPDSSASAPLMQARRGRRSRKSPRETAQARRRAEP